MSDEESKCDFCGRKIGEDDSFYFDNKGHNFCDEPCLFRFQMGDNDKCANCNKKIFGCVLCAKDFSNDDNLYFCSNDCFDKFNDKRADNKLECTDSIYGGYWAKMDEKN